jgi:hypothetical protein
MPLGSRAIDVAAVQDAFTITTVLFVEDLDISPKDEAGRGPKALPAPLVTSADA